MALEAENVTRQFMRLRGGSNVFSAVDDVSLTLENKKITVITGPSGSGKSTLLNIMAGILEPTKGTVNIEGTDLYSMSDEKLSRFRNECIGVVPQGQTAIQSLSTMDNVLMPYTLYHRIAKSQKKGPVTNAEADGKLRQTHSKEIRDASRKKDRSGSECGAAEDIRTRALELLEKTGIADLADVMPPQMSGGELRRMVIARAMIMNPDVILADEPTADLDEENTKAVLSLMRLAADEGAAVLIVTHDREVLPWADETYSLKAGRLEQAAGHNT